MTDHQPPLCDHPHPRGICDHISGPSSPCCNVDCYPCPQHFSVLIGEVMSHLVHNDQRQVTLTMSHIIRHDWLVPAVLTWSALIHRYAPLPGQTREAMADLAPDVAIPDGVGADEMDDQRPWMFRLEVIVRAAIMGDADMIVDTLMSVRGDAAMGPKALLSLLASIGLAAHDATDRHPVDGGTMALIHVLGSQTMNAAGFALLDTLVTIADSARGGDTDLPRAVVDRMHAATPDELLSGVGIAGRALGQIIDPEGHTGTGPLIVSTGGGGMGVIDWRDRSLDAGRDRNDMSPVWALRTAYAFARFDLEQVKSMCLDAEDSALFCVDTIVGACTMIGLEVGHKQDADA